MKAAKRLLCGIALMLATLGLSQAATVRTIGGFGAGFADGDNTVSKFNTPSGLAVDGNGRIYVADFGNNAIRLVDPVAEVASTFATAGLSGPSGVAIDSQGRVFVANTTAGNVRRFDPSGIASSVFATGLVNPVAVAVDNSGNVYIALRGGEIRRYNAAAVYERSYFVEIGAPSLSGLATLRDGQLAVSDAGNHVIWRFAVLGGPPEVMAGSLGLPGFAEGAINVGRLNAPQHIATATNGVVVVADRGNHRIRAVGNGGVLSTLYGTSEWVDPIFPGWTDDDENSEMREPVGVAVAQNNTVYDSEVFYHIIRKATGVNFPTNTLGNTNAIPPVNGTVGLNLISLGFAGGEASSDFVVAPGQIYSAPVTLTVAPGQPIYGMQFRVSITNLTGPAPADYGLSFDSMLVKPSDTLGSTRAVYTPIRNAAVTSSRFVTNFVVIPGAGGVGAEVPVVIEIAEFLPLELTTPNSISVGWLETKGRTNLYNTESQTLISFSLAHHFIYGAGDGKVIVGAVTVRIPPNAPLGSTYQMSIDRPSANGDGIQSDVLIEAPTGTNNPARVSAVKTLTVAPRGYLVGDVEPFRWFNSGEFGDGSILNNDLLQLQMALAYGYGYDRTEPIDSDFMSAMDSCCRDINGNTLNDINRINEIAFGDGVLTVPDLVVSFMRSLNPSLSNYFRFWSSTGLRAVPTNNTFRGELSIETAAATSLKEKPKYNTAYASIPSSAKFSAANLVARAGEVVAVPVTVEIAGPYSAKSMALKLSLLSRNGTPLITRGVSFARNPNLPAPTTGGSVVVATNGASFGAMWFETLSLPAGTYEIGTLSFLVPATATADAVYEIAFTHAEASTGLRQFPTTTANGLVYMANRTRFPWADEISDTWRIQNFGALNDILSAPDADADGDGLNNLSEYKAGTRPNDILSTLNMRGQRTSANPSINLSWPTVTGKLYRLQGALSIDGEWTTLEDNISGTGGQVERTRTFDASKARFYRVHLVE